MRKARGKREGRETHKWLAHLTFYRSPGKSMSKPPIPQALRVFDPQAYESGPRRVSSLVQNLSENLSCRLTDFQILKALPNAFSSIFGLYFALSLSVNSFLDIFYINILTIFGMSPFCVVFLLRVDNTNINLENSWCHAKSKSNPCSLSEISLDASCGYLFLWLLNFLYFQRIIAWNQLTKTTSLSNWFW